MKKILVVLACLAVISCAAVRPPNATNYKTDLLAPAETKNFVLVGQKVFDEPMFGIMLDYENKQYPTDNVDLYVYPIDLFNWKDRERVLKGEMEKIFREIDQAVEIGHYESRTEEVQEAFSVEGGDKAFDGLKASFEFTSPQGVAYHSNAYIFMEKDKFVKFRTSFDSRVTEPWNGDEFVAEILRELEVPGESAYMAELREEHRKQSLIYLIMQAAMQQGESEGESTGSGESRE